MVLTVQRRSSRYVDSALPHIVSRRAWEFHFSALLPVLWSSCIIALLPAAPGAAAQQLQSSTDLVYALCNKTTYATNSNFALNLNKVIGALLAHASSSLYASANATSANTSSTADNVYALYQCRGDLPLSQCRSCVSTFTYNAACSFKVGASVMLRGCFLRYENFPRFLTDGDFSTLVDQVPPTCSAAQNSSSEYQANLADALNLTAHSAPSRAGYNSSSRGGAYALAQCLGSLSTPQCATCLSQVSDYHSICGNSQAGEVYYVSCYYLFNNTSLLFSPDTAPTPPPPPPPPPSSIAVPPPFLPPATPLTGDQAIAKDKKSSTALPAVLGSSVAAAVLLLAVVAVLVTVLVRRRKSRKTAHKDTDRSSISGASSLFGGGIQRSFSLHELQEATDNFHPGNKLGEGGFGPVYKGRLKTSGTEVAIKMLSSSSRQGKAEFVSEVNLISSVQHRNLIQLLGCCVEDSQRLLVYEYLPNRSLDLLLFDDHRLQREQAARADGRRPLDWHTRLEIIVGIARGLSYLHEDSHLKIVHRDVKASNILLDASLNPKIADFGLARLFDDDATHITCTRVAGTLGYLAPEYAINGQLTEKADVYSFGLVALEVVSGRRIIDQSLEQQERQHLLGWAWEMYERQEVLEIVDPKIKGSLTRLKVDQVIRVVHLALLCTQTSAHQRPTMSQVYASLCGQSDILQLPTKPIMIRLEEEATNHHHHILGGGGGGGSSSASSL